MLLSRAFLSAIPRGTSVLKRRSSTLAQVPLHFVGANGFPSATYAPFLRSLGARFDVRCTDVYDHVSDDWHSMIAVVAKAVEGRQQGPVVLVGHSLGGALMKCLASLRPDLAKALVVIDPPMFEFKIRLAMAVAQRLGPRVVDAMIQPSRFAQTRKGVFASAEEAKAYHQSLKVYASFDPECLEQFIAAGLKPRQGGGCELAFSIEKEVQIYRTTPPDVWSPSHGQYAPVRCGGAFLYSKAHPLASAADVADLRKRLRPFPFVGFDGSHFFPLQSPTKAAELVLSVLSESTKNS
eukprot:RCo025109